MNKQTPIRSIRRPNAEGVINLSQRRAWYANTVAYGFLALKDMLSQRVNDVGVEVVNQAYIETAAAYQAEIDTLLDWFVTKTTKAKRRYSMANNGTLQPLDQWGNPDPRGPGGSYEVGWPIQGGGDAWGTNRVTRELMTVEEANRFALNVLTADTDWLRRHIIAALVTDTSWTFADENADIGDLTVQPLANGDSVEYLKRGTAAATDNHYLAQAAAILDASDPFPTIEDEINEHPTNNGAVVAFIPSNLTAAVRALAAFIPARDANIQAGLGSDQFVGSVPMGFGDTFMGYHESGVKLVEWRSMPSSYILFASENPGETALAMREYPVASLQGLFPEFHDADGNRHVNRFIRYAGFGALNRIAAGVMRIGNASYAEPSGYVAPLAV